MFWLDSYVECDETNAMLKEEKGSSYKIKDHKIIEKDSSKMKTCVKLGKPRDSVVVT